MKEYPEWPRLFYTSLGHSPARTSKFVSNGAIRAAPALVLNAVQSKSYSTIINLCGIYSQWSSIYRPLPPIGFACDPRPHMRRVSPLQIVWPKHGLCRCIRPSTRALLRRLGASAGQAVTAPSTADATARAHRPNRPRAPCAVHSLRGEDVDQRRDGVNLRLSACTGAARSIEGREISGGAVRAPHLRMKDTQ